MKKYLVPEIAVSLFDSESVATQVSEPGVTSAFDEAKTIAEQINETNHTFTVRLFE